MRRFLKGLAWLLAAMAVLVAVAGAVGSLVWSRGTASLRAELYEGEVTGVGVGPATDPALPPPVARYLARALPDTAARIRFAEIVHEGDFQMGEGEDGWRPFRSTQLFRVYPPAFVWDATITMAPLLGVRVRDAYLGGRGVMKAAIAGVVPVMDAEPTPGLAQGALYRYLAEAAWFPTRLLPGAGVSWTAEDDSTAWATLEDRGHVATLRFRFSPEGDIVEVYAPDRLREENGSYLPTPWVGRFDEQLDVEGFRVPAQGQVSWVVEGVPVPYWRGRVVEARFELRR